jgi:hypothetical protein
MTRSELITTVIAGLALVINVVYVALTFMMLRATKRDSLREHRLRHLEDIKQLVARPLIDWLEDTSIPAVDGRQLPINVRDTPIPRSNAELGDVRVDYRRHLEPTWHTPPEMQGRLFKHARDVHFPMPLKAFEEFENRQKQFLAEMAALGRECANAIARMTKLTRRSGNAGPNTADADNFVAGCFKDFLCELRPQTTRYEPSDQVFQIQHGYTGTLASGPRVEIEDWWKRADAEVVDRWAKTDMFRRARQLVAEAQVVREHLRELEYTYDLGKDCEYVGAKTEPSAR